MKQRQDAPVKQRKGAPMKQGQAGRQVDVISMTMSGIWLVFLVYPVSSLLTRPARDQAIGFALMGLFVVGYLAMLRRLGIDMPRSQHRLQVVIFAGLVAIAVASSQVLGSSAMGYVPFLTAAAIWGLWTPVNRWSGLATLVAALLVSLALGVTSDSVNVLLAGVLILVVGWLVTWMVEKGIADEARERRLLVVEERNRIASDVHDLLGHSLTVVNLKLQLIDRLMEANPGRAHEELTETRAIVAEALGNVRRTVSMERSSSLADELEHARGALRDNDVELLVEGSPDAPTGPMAVILGWVLRECVTNVLRHAHASRVRVTISPRRLAVEDDGDGLAGTAHDGNGLRGMHERVAAAGGELTVGHGELGGVKVDVTW
ncbi:sensor histidine kinase [Luteococcus sp. OSA5]|uniref:sensor histidine kinase n=1 Tax=Luteococcus sp. OSA5 TaxID=3401630 RepID=UPI003B42B62D